MSKTAKPVEETKERSSTRDGAHIKTPTPIKSVMGGADVKTPAKPVETGKKK